MSAQSLTKCGHESNTFDHSPLNCELPVGHQGPHEQSVTLRDRTERTNWRDDGKALWARGQQ